MCEKQIIFKNKRKPIYIEISNKDIAFGHYKNLCKYQKNNKNNSEDDYDYYVYNELICKDKIFFGNNEQIKKQAITKSFSNIFNHNRDLCKVKNSLINNFDKNCKNNTSLNLSFENRNKNFFLDTDKMLIFNKDKSENCKNLTKIINLFSFINKKRQNKLLKEINQNNNLILNSGDRNSNHIKISNRFSRKRNKNINITENINSNKNRYTTALEKRDRKSKIIKIEKYKNDSCLMINQKKYQNKLKDIYNISLNYNDISEQNTKMVLKGNYLNSSMRKININLNDSSINRYITLNKSKNKNHSIYYSNPKRVKKERKIKDIIKSYMNKEKEEKLNKEFKQKKNENFGSHRIIKKRVILEEEYIINSEGDERLLSVRRLDNNNEENNKSNYLQKYFMKEKTINNENPMNKNYKLNNSFFSSIFKDNTRKASIKSIDEDNHISYLFSNNNMSKRNQKKSKNIMKNLSHKNKSVESNGKILINKIPIKTDLKECQYKEQKINKDLSNKELNLKKKLFFNRIYFNKFNKSNNNSKINCHPSYINSNRTSINCLEDKDKSNMDTSKGIYNKISFSKKQPFMIYHNEEKNQNFYINNNQNCSNMVNIVFLNDDKNKINNNIERPKPIYDLKRNNYKFEEIKSKSDDNNNSQVNSTRNHCKKQIMKVLTCDNNNEVKKNSFNIYSSMDNANDKRIKKLEILEYISPNIKPEMDNIKRKYIKKLNINKSGISQYFINYYE